MGAVGTVTVKPPATAVALRSLLATNHDYPEIGFNSRGEYWASDSDESSVDLAGAISGLDDRVGGQEGDGGASGNVAVLGVRGEYGKGLNWELHVAGWARDDEGRGKGVDLVERQRGVEWSWE